MILLNSKALPCLTSFRLFSLAFVCAVAITPLMCPQGWGGEQDEALEESGTPCATTPLLTPVPFPSTDTDTDNDPFANDDPDPFDDIHNPTAHQEEVFVKPTWANYVSPALLSTCQELPITAARFLSTVLIPGHPRTWNLGTLLPFKASSVRSVVPVPQEPNPQGIIPFPPGICRVL